MMFYIIMAPALNGTALNFQSTHNVLTLNNTFTPQLASFSTSYSNYNNLPIQNLNTDPNVQVPIHINQEFLAENPHLWRNHENKNPWISVALPNIAARSFKLQLTAAFANNFLPHFAYAAHFIVNFSNAYFNLGNSMILHRNSDPLLIFDYLFNVFEYYQNLYEFKADSIIIMKFKNLGHSTNYIKDLIVMNQHKSAVITNPCAAFKSLASLPFPQFDYLNIWIKALTLRNPSHFHINKGVALSFCNTRSATFFVTPDGNESVHLSSVKPLPVLSDPQKAEEWLLANGNSLSISGHFFNHSKNIAIGFKDSLWSENAFNRATRLMNLNVNRVSNEIQGFNAQWNPRRLFSNAKPLNNFCFKPHAIITADIEALIQNRKLNIPYAAQFYGRNEDGSEFSQVFTWQQYNLNPFEMLKNFWWQLLIRAQSINGPKTVYFHNWAGYDAFHALNPLVHIAQTLNYKLSPILRNGKIINIKIIDTSNNKIVLDIKDSILILPSSLGALAKAFKLPVHKEHFPHYFDVLNVSKDASYIGDWPSYDCFEPKRTSLQDYHNLIKHSPTFNFMEHTLKYLNLDVVLLHQILSMFFEEIGTEFLLNPRNSLSIPGIAFKAWKIHQLPVAYKQNNTKIYDFSNSYDNFFREAYLGAIVDVYRPVVRNGFYYDINSLYPTAMLNELPTGKPIFQSLTVDEFMKGKFFGFIKATVHAPHNIKIPILPVRRDGKLITPVGTFNGTWFSEELYFAVNNGYKVLSIAFAYQFTRSANVFADLIHKLSNMKIQAEKDGLPARRNLAKLMMNSTYGRFGMHTDNNTSIIANPEEARIIAAAFNIVRVIPFSNGFELIEYIPVPNMAAVDAGLVTLEQINQFLPNNSDSLYSDTNVPIAAAITAYSRMIINRYKVEASKLGIQVIYSDTDSLVTNKTLPQEWLHPTEFGKFKLEHTIVLGYFLAPKLYWLEAVDGNGNTYHVSKSRGYGGSLNLDQVLKIYQGGTVSLPIHRWLRDWDNHTVNFNMEATIELTGEFSKRVKTYDPLTGNWISTRPFIYQEPITPPLALPQPSIDLTSTKGFWIIQNLITLKLKAHYNAPKTRAIQVSRAAKVSKKRIQIGSKVRRVESC